MLRVSWQQTSIDKMSGSGPHAQWPPRPQVAFIRFSAYVIGLSYPGMHMQKPKSDARLLSKRCIWAMRRSFTPARLLNTIGCASWAVRATNVSLIPATQRQFRHFAETTKREDRRPALTIIIDFFGPQFCFTTLPSPMHSLLSRGLVIINSTRPTYAGNICW